jgi:hypothetical protein
MSSRRTVVIAVSKLTGLGSSLITFQPRQGPPCRVQCRLSGTVLVRGPGQWDFDVTRSGTTGRCISLDEPWFCVGGEQVTMTPWPVFMPISPKPRYA